MEGNAMSSGRLIFDGRCGFCTRSVHWLKRLDRHGRVEAVPLQSPGAPASIGATEEQCSQAVQWLGSDGRHHSAAAAVNAALSAALGTRLPLWLHAATRPVQDRIYDWVANNRSRLPGMAPHCTEYPEDCAP